VGETCGAVAAVDEVTVSCSISLGAGCEAGTGAVCCTNAIDAPSNVNASTFAIFISFFLTLISKPNRPRYRLGQLSFSARTHLRIISRNMAPAYWSRKRKALMPPGPRQDAFNLTMMMTVRTFASLTSLTGKRVHT